MSASMLHYAHGLRGIQYKSTVYTDGSIIIKAILDQTKETCPICKSSRLHFKDSKERHFKMCPTSNKFCWLHLIIRRRYCADCFHKWWPRPSFVSSQRRMVRTFEKHVLRLVSGMTLEDTAKLLGLSWHTVRDIHKDYLKRKYSKSFELKKLIYLGIDEFSIGKNHDYMTIFIDLDTSQIIHAVEGRTKEVITPFLKKLAKKAIGLMAIAMDMSGPYKSAVNEFLPNRDIVFDRFHVMKLMNKAIDEIRREQHRIYKKQGEDVLKGSRYLLLSNVESLEPERRTGLQTLLEMNAPLACAHMLKEQLREFWNQQNHHDSVIFLVKWIYCGAFESGINQLAKVAKTLLHHHRGLTN